MKREILILKKGIANFPNDITYKYRLCHKYLLRFQPKSWRGGGYSLSFYTLIVDEMALGAILMP